MDVLQPDKISKVYIAHKINKLTDLPTIESTGFNITSIVFQQNGGRYLFVDLEEYTVQGIKEFMTENMMHFPFDLIIYGYYDSTLDRILDGRET